MGIAKYFISIYVCNGCWQCHIADKDIPKTTLFTRYGLYKCIVMPMGLTKAPDIFTQSMNNLFSDMLDSSMVVFLDDILVYSCMVKEHFILLEKVLVCSRQYMLCCKLKKCSFLCNSTIFQGLKYHTWGYAHQWLKSTKLEWMDFTYYTKISTVILRLFIILPLTYTQFQCHCKTIDWHAKMSHLHG